MLNTISQARAPSTRCLYALKGLSSPPGVLPQRKPSGMRPNVDIVLPARAVGKDCFPSMLKVYVAAIAASHAPIDGQSVGRNNLVVRFLKGSRRLNPPRPHRPDVGSACL